MQVKVSNSHMISFLLVVVAIRLNYRQIVSSFHMKKCIDYYHLLTAYWMEWIRDLQKVGLSTLISVSNHHNLDCKIFSAFLLNVKKEQHNMVKWFQDNFHPYLTHPAENCHSEVQHLMMRNLEISKTFLIIGVLLR